MSNSKNIFSGEIKLDYQEYSPPLSPKDFADVVMSRRSVRCFDGQNIPEDIINNCLDLALLAPTSSNLQCWEFYWVKTEPNKKALAYACFNQSAARTAGELIVAVARTETWDKVRRQILGDLEKSPEKPPKAILSYYAKLVPFVYTQGWFSSLGFLRRIFFSLVGLLRPVPREPLSHNDMRVWATKTTALACAHLMLALRSYGYDSCPMEGFDSKRVKKILELPADASVVMVIGAGKRAKYGIWGPRMRLPRSQFIKEI